ncbi:hypothetical protein BFL38_09720 [Brachyspira hampsonii]|uniref:Uncharacterized protein n=1 Tax=Brachyspira hampsonii TaxID=1287055 RepID=A0A1E5NHU9_9SPIR|nr:tetratricopeptide repeat protein [Brachyspira hampsonii]OEJ15735.1 hypothetical protein BFL38_09720 [Brachyspira hampsonii]
MKNIIKGQNNNTGTINSYQIINLSFITININISIDSILEKFPSIKKFFSKSKLIVVKNNSKDEVNNLNNEGVEYFLKGEFKKAIDYFEKAISIDNSVSEIHYNLGNAKFYYYAENIKKYNILEMFNEIIAEYSNAISLKEDYRYYYNRGTLYAFIGKYNLALDDLSKSIDIDKLHPEPYINRANIYLIKNNNNDAEKDLKMAEELANKEDHYLLSVLYNNIGNTYLQKNNLYNAEKYYKESLKINKEYIYPILGMAILYMKKYEESKNNAEYKKSLEMFDKAEKIDNNFDGIYYNKSHLYNIKASISNNKNDYLCSIELLDKAIECAQLNGNNKSLYYYAKGIVYSNLYNLLKENEYKDKVITSYLLSIELNKDDFNPYYNLANFYDSIGNKTEAINYYTKAISINPKHESSYNNRAAIFIEQQQYDNAISDINKIVEINQNNFGAYYNLGVIYTMQNKIQLAIEYFYRCVNSLNNKDNKIKMNSYYNLGILKGRMGDNESAINDIIKSYELGNKNCINIIKEEAYKYNNKIAISYLNGKII